MNAKQVAKQYPQLHAWFFAKQHPWAIRMMDNLRSYDKLSDKQIEVSLRIMQEGTNPAPLPSAELDLAAIETAFNRARSSGVRAPKMTLAHFTFKAAGSNSANPGAIYILDRDHDEGYLGKVLAGRFTLSRNCSPEQVAEVQTIVADPKSAAIAFGKEWGVCCICNRTLTDETSIANGIGPICAERFGW